MVSMIVALMVAHPPIPHFEGPRHLECPPTEWAMLAGQIADVDPYFLMGVVMTESRGKATAEGDCKDGKCHSFGMWQMNVGTCKGLYPRCKKKDLFDPHFSSVMAGLLWRYLIKKVGRENAAVAYNCGHRCKKKGRWYSHTKVTRGYFKRYVKLTTGDFCYEDLL